MRERRIINSYIDGKRVSEDLESGSSEKSL